MLIGLVGVPNSGKSTFLKALTLVDVEIASYPFTTIEPNQAVGYVITSCPCKELEVTCNPQNSKCIDGKRWIPVKLLDVAGLVPDAHLGKGLGNKFLDELRQADGLIHILDCSGLTDAEGKPNKWDPEKNINVLEEEIDAWLFGIISKDIEKLKKQAETEKKPLERLLAGKLSGLGITEEMAKEAIKIASVESKEFVTELRKISKPILIAANKIDLKEAQENFERLKEKYDLIPCSAEAELALKEASEHKLIKYMPGSSKFEICGELTEKQKEALEFIQNNVLARYGSTGVQKALNKVVFEILNYIVVYPVANINRLTDKMGNILPDAHLVKKGTTLKEFAEKIHTEIKERFIGGLEQKTKKKLGAEYELQNNDIVEILFSK